MATRSHNGKRQEELLHAAAVTQLALLKRDPAGRRAMPAAVRERLARQAEAWDSVRRDKGAGS